MTSQTSPQEQDYPLSPVPLDQRKSLWSMGFVLLGFTFFTATIPRSAGMPGAPRPWRSCW